MFDWVKDGDTYMWDDRVVDQKTAEKYHGETATYIAKEATVTARKDGVLGATISLHSDGTISKLGETLPVNSDETFTNANGSKFVPRQTDGEFLGVSAGFAAVGGFGISIGVVKDALGETKPYFSFSGNIGFGVGIEAEMGDITPTKNNQFLTDDFAGKGAAYNGSVSLPYVSLGVGYAGSLDSDVHGGKAMNPANFGNNDRGYLIKQGTASRGLGGYLTYSNSRTWVGK